ncbi:hypothetical protein L484_022868 [Morus notabilis]|uniref:Uncharacterized protein n=1 Tax=Morus notabilis TaxID=981085 RepID=W9RST3_9ROSA|nr:hypothetical protein L484_022868 [Morus notabilis]
MHSTTCRESHGTKRLAVTTNGGDLQPRQRQTRRRQCGLPMQRLGCGWATEDDILDRKTDLHARRERPREGGERK